MRTAAQGAEPPVMEICMDADLPEGWTSTTLETVCCKVTDGTHKTPTYADEGIPFISTTNLVPFESGFDFSQYQRFITRREHEELTERTRPERGDILISKCGTIGRTKEVDVEYPFSIFVGVALLKLHPGVFASRFLAVLLNSPHFQDKFDELAPGSTRRTLTIGAIKTLDVTVPPIAEQKRIVARVEELLRQVNAARDRLAKVPKILKRFRQSVLAAACSGRLTEDWRTRRGEDRSAETLLTKIDDDRREAWAKTQGRASRVTNHPVPQPLDSDELPDTPTDWAWATLDQIGQEGRPIVYGIIKPGPHVPNGVPYVRINEMVDGEPIDVSLLRRASLERAMKFARATLAAGDLLISKDGTIGRVAIVPPELVGGNVTQHVVRVPVHPFIVRDYIVAAIRSQHSQRWLTRELKGVALQGVNVEDFRRLPLPIPPVEEQKEIVARLRPLLKRADAIEKRVEAATKGADKLTDAILAKAFRGVLVPTEAELARREARDYEPASALLERIRTEREAKSDDKTKLNQHRRKRKIAQRA